MHRLLLMVSCCWVALSSTNASHAELALVIDQDGISPEITFGEVVEVSLSPDHQSVSIGGGDYPSASFGLSKDGCFEVGIQQGIDNEVYREPRFEGNGEHSGESVVFSAEVSSEIGASAEVCPVVDAPFQLTPEKWDGGESGKPPPQRMGVSSVHRVIKRGVSGKPVSASLDAFCLDADRAAPGSGDTFRVDASAQARMTAGVQSILRNASKLEDPQDCIWEVLAPPDDRWKSFALEYWLESDTPDADAGATLIRTKVADDQRGFRTRCGVDKAASQWTEAELKQLLSCFDSKPPWECM